MFSIKTIVYGSDGSMTSEMINCEISISDSTSNGNECIMSFSDIIDSFTNPSVTNIFQITDSALVYIDSNSNSFTSGNTDCVESNLEDIINILYDKFGTSTADLCQSSNVIQLGMSVERLLKLIRELILAKNTIHNWFEQIVYQTSTTTTTTGDHFIAILNDLLHQILDPCDIFDTISSLQNLEVTATSVITSQPIIFYSLVSLFFFAFTFYLVWFSFLWLCFVVSLARLYILYIYVCFDHWRNDILI